MATPHTQHPSPVDLSAFAAGKLAAADARAVAAHLESCPDCRRAAGRSGGDPSASRSQETQPSRPREETRLPGPQPPAGPPLALPPELANHPRYKIRKELGRGGMGVVYQAEQTLMDRLVAIKVINKAVLDHPDALERFRREVKAAAQLHHPNIVIAHDAEQAGDLHMLVMEYVEGQSLAQVLQRKGPLPLAHACHYVRQAALGLQHACEHGMVHRDIKPQNLMLTPKGQVKILDFGLAKVASQNQQQSALTAVSAYMGTPDYSAPEQASDARTADIRADIYSLGCTLYCLLAGHPPFQADTAVQTILAHLGQEPRPLPELRGDVPQELWAVVARMLAKDPAQRYQKPAEVVQALTPFCKVAAKPAGAPAPAAVTPQRAGPTDGASPFEALTEGAAKAGPAGKPGRPARGRQPAAPGKRWLLLGGAAGALVLCLGVGLVALLVLRGKTSDGVVVLQVEPADAEVFVDGDRIAVTPPGDREPFEVHVLPGARRLEVRKGGYKARAQDLSVTAGGRQTLHVRLEKLPDAAPEPVAVVPVKPAEPAEPPPLPVARTAPPGPDAEGFVSLFDGQTLNGWVIDGGDPQTWQVEDGAIVAHGVDSRSRNYLLSRRDYGDFILRLEYSLDANTGAGVAIRARPGENLPLGNGRIFDHPVFKLIASPGGEETGMTHWVLDRTRVKPDRRAEQLPTGSWNRLEIEVRGRTLRASVNGRPVLDTTLDADARFGDGTIPALNRPKGRIGLQKHTGIARFRNITIKELAGAVVKETPPPPAPPATAPVAATEGFVPLFNGKDLGGWRVLGGGTGAWEVVDGVLTSGGPPSLLFTERGDFTNFHLRAEVMINDGGNSGLFGRAPLAPGWRGYEAQIDSTHRDPVKTGSLHPAFNSKLTPEERAKITVLDVLVRPNTWFTHEMIVFGHHIVIRVNGRQTVDFVDRYHTFALGHIALQQLEPTTVVRFRKIEVKELTSDPTAPAGTAAAEPDPVKEGLARAWLAYLDEMARYRQGTLELFDKREEEARKTADRTKVDRVKANRDAFLRRGEHPPAEPADLRQQRFAARGALEAALSTAVQDYTKAGKDREAAALEQELKERRREALFPAGRYQVVYKNNFRAVTDLHADYGFHRVRKDGVLSDGPLEFNNPVLTLRGKDFIEVWKYANGKLTVEYWAPPGNYPGKRPQVVGEATLLHE